MLKGGRDCYDPYERNIYSLKGGEVTTHNRFSPIAEYNDKMKEALHDDKKPPDSYPVQEKKNLRRVYFEKYEDCVLGNNSVNFCSNNYVNDDYNSFMYVNPGAVY